MTLIGGSNFYNSYPFSFCAIQLFSCSTFLSIDPERVTAFIEGRLQGYEPVRESVFQQTVRISKSVLHVARHAVGIIPVGNQVSRMVSGLYYLLHYGPLALYSSEIFETISLVVKLIRSVNTSIPWPDIAIRVYYMMAEQRGVRLRGENAIVASPNGCITNSLINTLCHYCGLAVHIAYEASRTDAQRLLALQGYTLVLAGTAQSGSVHPFFLACRGKKEVVVIFPGTRGIGDVQVNMNAFDMVIDGSKNFSTHKGLGTVAQKLVSELQNSLLRLQASGYSNVVVVGHSLGAAIGSIFTHLLRDCIKEIVCFGFGCPPCVSTALGRSLQDSVTNVVLRDDIVCRASVRNIEKLLTSLVDPSTHARIKEYLHQDLINLGRNWKFFFLLQSRPWVDVAEFDDPALRNSKPGESWWSRLRNRVLRIRGNVNEPEVKDDRMVIPGKIVYIYPQNGVGSWEAFFINACDPRLMSINLQTEMVSDHLGEAYFRALLQTGAGVRVLAKPVLKNTCACCGHDFLWNSVLKGEPHSWLAKHVCRKCGAITCDACSGHQRAVPELGLYWPVRHCDRCWLTVSRL